MARFVSVGYTLTAGAGASGEVTLYTVEAARIFKVTDVTVNFPSGQGFKLKVKLFRGVEQIAPYQGEYAGDGAVIHDKLDCLLHSSERLRLSYVNGDTVNPQSIFILVGGCLE